MRAILKRGYSLTFIILATLLIGFNGARYYIFHSMALPPSIPMFLDSESILALGARIPLSQSGVYEFELIKGVSDNLAFRLEEQKKTLRSEAQKLPSSQRYKTYMRIRGIGEKTAWKIGQHIDPMR